jgi:carboxyl-terminal processing protease
MVAHAAKGLCAIDPYSKCFSDDEYEKEQQSLVSHYQGIGIVVASEKSGARITDVRIKSPAEKAGLLIGDIVTHVVVDKKKRSLVELSKEEQLALIDGTPGTTASLVLLRDRRIVSPPPIARIASVAPTVERVQLLARHYGSLRIRRFAFEQTAEELRYAIDMMKQRGVLYGLVIDLRGNGGGSFFESVNMAGFFLDGGVVTTTFSRIEGRKSYSAPQGDILLGVPIVLLVDRNSASASELFAGALSDRDVPRAILIGEKTYGKGIGQTTEAGPGGGKVVMTSFEFFTPKGNGVHGKGFTPDSSLLEIFYDEKADDAWQGAALKYLLFEHRSHQASQ